ncbi:hypothetical protein [Arthrospiribacter ruber]|uniref:Gliding motility protein RemB n=1 Tax=Arthrospiribacter ruber TaxID=2487934 RepID=A0A951J092_9BACT|nr:hypothetical protein [Arthrospiribacter ruber]MBW3470400.1 hypothetical protein [Arthrospiribacter ruber]
MKNKLLFACSILLFFSENTFGQGAYIPYNRDYYHLIERFEILEGKNNPIFHTGFKPFRRDQVASYLDTLATGNLIQSNVDRFNLNYLSNDNWEFIDRETENSKRPLLGGLYRKPSDFFHYRDSIFDFHINPVIYLSGGMEPNQENFRMRNSRGVEFRGSIDRKVSFYTYFTTTQTIFPSWVKDYVEQNGAVPGEGFWKRYEGEGYGYFSAMGHVNFNISKSIQAQFGHDRNFVGEGYRSLIISDFSNPYVFVKLNTKIWKFNLTNLWSQKTADVTYDFAGRPTDDRYPQKWFSHHRLGINIGKNLNVGVFESVMKNEFDWNYLNPLIFYRWVEHQLGTPDKVMLGTDLKWNFTPGMQLYGQFVLDEFVFGEFFGIDGPNSIRNKHALQAGYKYINAFKVSNLDLQLEYNQVRPYTYQEKFENQSFTNYRTPLAHPLGANFREAVAIVRYQPVPRLFTNMTMLYQYFGDDPSEDVNFGKNVLKNRMSPNTGIGLFGNVIGQGVENRVLLANLNLSYMIRQNVFLDLSQTFRTRTAEDLDSPANTSFTQLSLRVNMIRNDFNY